MFQAGVLRFQPVDDIQLLADKTLHYGFLDVITGMDGLEELIEEGLEVSLVEGFGCRYILHICLCLLQGTVNGLAVVEALGESYNFGTYEYIGAADGLFSCIPSSDVHRLSATYACPPANTPPVKSMTTRLKVSPWLLWTVMAHASRTGYWVKVPNSSSSICFFLRCICSGYSARTPVSHHIPCRRR